MPHFPLDDENPGWIKGWAVIRQSPWHLHGVFPSRVEADVFHAALGEDYEVVYGSRRLATDDFMFEPDHEVAQTPKVATRWQRNSEYLELEGVSGEKGSALVINTNISWEFLPLELKEQHRLSARNECMAMYEAARRWAKQNGYTGVGGA